MSTLLRVNIPAFIKSEPQPAPRDEMARAIRNFGRDSDIPLVGLSRDEFQNLLDDSKGAERMQTPAHFTTSCMIFNPNFEKVLLVLHAKYQQWVTPGGHADGDWFWLRSALRECWEETGLTDVEVLPATYVKSTQKTWGVEPRFLLPQFIHQFDVEAFGDMGAHAHFDAVYLLHALSEDVRIDANESLDIRWFQKSTFDRVLSDKAQLDEMKIGNETAGEVLRCFQFIDGL